MMIRCSIIKAMIAERRVDDIHAATVGIFRRTRPVILLGKALGALILASYQQVFRFRRHTHIVVGRISSHGRKHHRAMFHLSKDILGLRHHEVPDARQLDIVQCRNLIRIHESAIEHGNHHTSAQMVALVEPLAVHRLQLGIGSSIESGTVAPFVQLLSHPRPYSLAHGIGSDEDLHHLADEIEAVKLAEFLLLVDADEQGVVPLALAHYLDAGICHCLFVGRSQGQVGEVDRESLSLAPFDGSCREELLRAVHRIGIMVEVFILEVKTIQHTFAAWVGHHVDASHPIIVGKQCKRS